MSGQFLAPERFKVNRQSHTDMLNTGRHLQNYLRLEHEALRLIDRCTFPCLVIHSTRSEATS